MGSIVGEHVVEVVNGSRDCNHSQGSHCSHGTETDMNSQGGHMWETGLRAL